MHYHELMIEAVIRVELRYGILPVLKNPMHRQTSNAFQKFGNTLRGSIDTDGSLYVWDAAEAAHSDVEDKLGVAIAYRFMMRGNGVVETENDDVEQIAAIPTLRRAYGGEFEVERIDWND